MRDGRGWAGGGPRATAPPGSPRSGPGGAVAGHVHDQDSEDQAHARPRDRRRRPRCRRVRRAARWALRSRRRQAASGPASGPAGSVARSASAPGGPDRSTGSGAGRGRCPVRLRDRVRLPRPSGVPGLGLRRPHAHLPVAYRPRWWMQRITASGTSPSTGSPCSRRRRSSVLETSNGAAGTSTARQPGGTGTGVRPGPAHHGQGDQVPECGLVVPGGETGHHVRPDHQGELGPRFVRQQLTDGVHGVGRAAPVDLDAAGRQARPPVRRRLHHGEAVLGRRDRALPSFCQGWLATTSSIRSRSRVVRTTSASSRWAVWIGIEGARRRSRCGAGLGHR